MDWRIGKTNIRTAKFRFLAVPLICGGLLLAACGSSAGANAKKSCEIVDSALASYTSAKAAAGSALSETQKIKELNLLRSALPYAAIAAGSNLEYQALQATLSETNRVPERLLVSALTRECRQILPKGPSQQVPGGYVPPSNIKANPTQ